MYILRNCSKKLRRASSSLLQPLCGRRESVRSTSRSTLSQRTHDSPLHTALMCHDASDDNATQQSDSTDWVKALHPTRHKTGHFWDVPQANLLAWCGKTKPDTTKEHIHQYVLQHKINKKPGLVASYDIRPGNGHGLFCFQWFIKLSLTYLLRQLPTCPRDPHGPTIWEQHTHTYDLLATSTWLNVPYDVPSKATHFNWQWTNHRRQNHQHNMTLSMEDVDIIQLTQRPNTAT